MAKYLSGMAVLQQNSPDYFGVYNQFKNKSWRETEHTHLVTFVEAEARISAETEINWEAISVIVKGFHYALTIQ